MKIAYSIKNLRRLLCTPSIEVRPITILLGRNSVGKSTFLRSFPLLRQSLETKSSAPILWYGDYVDFGNFKSSVFNKEVNRNIEFAFEIRDYETSIPFVDRYGRSITRYRSRRKLEVDHLKISYGVGLRSNSTAREYVEVEVPSQNSSLFIEFDDRLAFASEVQVNNFNLLELLPSYEIFMSTDSVFSEPQFFHQRYKDKKRQGIYLENRRDTFLSLIESELRKNVDKRTGGTRISFEARRVLRFEFLDEQNFSILLGNSETKTFMKIYTDILTGKREELKERLDSICRANHLFNLLSAVSYNLSRFFRAVEYIGPARARSERFYRLQELEVSDISPDGKNLPMFLASLTYRQLNDFSRWVERAFGYAVKVRRTEGHVSIDLEQDGQAVNIVDTGYGVSQVLPVLAQIWWMQHSDISPRYHEAESNLNVRTLAIEQPELHLHPAHQALLADVFAESVSSETIDTNETQQFFLVETHSEALINRLGELIESGLISESDVQVIIFGDTQNEEVESTVSIAEFDELGVLQNWPYGFFNYD